MDYQQEFLNKYLAKQTHYIQELMSLRIRYEAEIELKDMMNSDLAKKVTDLENEIEVLKAEVEKLNARAAKKVNG